MCGGTGRIGVTRRGWLRAAASAFLWQRLTLRPLPHQHGSFDLRLAAAIGAVGAVLMCASTVRPSPSLPGGRLGGDQADEGADALLAVLREAAVAGVEPLVVLDEVGAG